MTDHAIQRARERYGLELTASDIKGIGRDISEGRAVLALRLDTGSLWMVRFAGQVLIAVTKHVPNGVLTFLPHDAVTSGSRERSLERSRKRTGRMKRRRRRKCPNRKFTQYGSEGG